MKSAHTAQAQLPGIISGDSGFQQLGVEENLASCFPTAYLISASITVLGRSIVSLTDSLWVFLNFCQS